MIINLFASDFIREIQERLQDTEGWKPETMEFVPAPKNQRWRFRFGSWGPIGDITDKIRPLAHVHLQDQVVATGLMMCLADRVETVLGDPRSSPLDENQRHQILAYGHENVSVRIGSELRHSWGSAKLYRQYFEDYQTFLKRPMIVANQLSSLVGDFEIAIVQSDFSKFYDRVRPQMLIEKLRKFMRSPEERNFFNLAGRISAWRWAYSSQSENMPEQHDIPNFDTVALPQGLVSAGFFANVALNDFESRYAKRGAMRSILMAIGA
ncbi:MAG: hypothetical protein U5R30_04735 [Deltaproteobacteria bacterium]|nr:hypothetical protein [Deltaproteobacteria bacterium]